MNGDCDESLLQLVGHFRNSLEEIGDESVISDLENWRLRVLVDGHDRLRVLHSGQVLDGARDGDGNVQILEEFGADFCCAREQLFRTLNYSSPPIRQEAKQ